MVFEDFAKATGATIIEDATGKTFKNLTFEDLGTCDRIEIEKEEIVLNPSVDLTEHIADLKAKGYEDSLRRVFWLTSKTAKLKLGAVNEGELSLLRLKATDACHSAKLALEYGVVDGGGLCLRNVARELPENVIKDIMEHVLQAPHIQIVKNMKLEKTIQSDILDASAVCKNAIRNAIGIACRALTTNTFIDLPKRTTEDLQLEILGRQMRNF
jgi:chaperonin GroEL